MAVKLHFLVAWSAEWWKKLILISATFIVQTHYGIYSPWLLNEPVKIEWSHFLVPSSSKEENDSQYLAKLTI